MTPGSYSLWVGPGWVGSAVPAAPSQSLAGWGRTPAPAAFQYTGWRSARFPPWAAFGWGSSGCSSSMRQRPHSLSSDVSSPSVWPLSCGPWSLSSFCTAYRPRAGTGLGSEARSEVTGWMEKLCPLFLWPQLQHPQTDSHTSPSWSSYPGSQLGHTPRAGERGSSSPLPRRSAGQGRNKGWSRKAPYWTTLWSGCKGTKILATLGTALLYVVFGPVPGASVSECTGGACLLAWLEFVMSGRCVENNWCGATVGWHLNPSACCRIIGLNLARAPRNLTRRLAVATHLHFTSLWGLAL